MKAKAALSFLSKSLAISLTVGLVAGTAGAVFLISLDAVTEYRESRPWLLLGLPLGGFLVGWIYHYYGKGAEGGNRLLLQAIDAPENPIPFRMGGLVYLGTLITHLFGGSAGREGTALQMAGALTYPLKRWLTREEIPLLLVSALAAGFGAVFGTPWSGAVFALEVSRKRQLKFILPALSAAFIANAVTLRLGAGHTVYEISELPPIALTTLSYTALSGLAFGGCAALFIRTLEFSTQRINGWIAYPPFRPLLGGTLVAALMYAIGTEKFMGLGIPSIVTAFHQAAAPTDFLLKLAFTVLTLGSGFRGGEVTPLFFIGATLGSALSLWLPLPIELLAGIGFVAVFGAASKTPGACIILGLELFGWGPAVFLTLACGIAFICSGKKSIYR
jgi:H+/Cl- antiporter ClcA